jgi:hydroxymethylpyrimidine/phosphomethylpyrimidine kinase
MDIKIFSTIGVYAFAVPTAIVEESTDTVRSMTGMRPSVLRGQLDILLDHAPVAGVKIGMLFNMSTARLIGTILSRRRLTNIVLDPVLVSSSGAPLVRDSRKDSIRALLPLCTVVTPNIPEASDLSGITIRTKNDMLRAAHYFITRGTAAVVIKGGHFAEKGLDLYMDRRRHVFLKARRLRTDVHGTGCSLCSAITAYLIRGHAPLDAVRKAKALTHQIIRNSRTVSPALHRFVAMPVVPAKFTT